MHKFDNGNMYSAFNNYKFKTNLWKKFTESEKDGLNGIRNAYASAMRDYSNDMIAFSEMAYIFSYKNAEHYHDFGKQKEIGNLYQSLYNNIIRYGYNKWRDLFITKYVSIL